MRRRKLTDIERELAKFYKENPLESVLSPAKLARVRRAVINENKRRERTFEDEMFFCLNGWPLSG
jgi:hypothetical protein